MNAPDSQPTAVSAAVAEVVRDPPASDFQRLLSQPMGARDLLLNEGSYNRIWQIATTMADGKLSVPDHLRGSIADCLAIVVQAFEWGMNPYSVAQKTHVINGRLGYEAQLIMAVVKHSGAIDGRFHFEFDTEAGATLCRAGAVLRGEDRITWTEWYSSASVKVKNSPLWQTNVPQQMGYLQGRNWARLYAPDAILGVYTLDELEQGLALVDAATQAAAAVAPAAAPLRVGRKAPKPADAAPAATPVPTPPPPPASAPAAELAALRPDLAPPAVDPFVTAMESAEKKNGAPAAEPRKTDGPVVGLGEVAYLRLKAKERNIDLAVVLADLGGLVLERLSREDFERVKARLVS